MRNGECGIKHTLRNPHSAFRTPKSALGTTAGPTPLMQQYQRIKSLHPDAILFFRLGDFYEMFYDDAILSSRLLGIVLTSREKGPGAVPMCGVPFHSAETYIQRLIQAGHRVAICEQVGMETGVGLAEDAVAARGLVDRQVIRVITPGTLTEEGLLEERANNFLASVVRGEKGRFALAWVDISTGEFLVEEAIGAGLLDGLARVSPAECLLPESLASDEPFARALRAVFDGMVTTRADWIFGAPSAEEELCRFFEVGSLEGFGIESGSLSALAAGAIVNYLNETQKTSLVHVRKVAPYIPSGHCIIDRASKRSLELVETLTRREREGSLIWVLDRTETPMGARLLRSWLEAPLAEAEPIRSRLEAVRELGSNSSLRKRLEGLLRGVSDIERIAAKVACGRATARDLLALARSLSVIPALKEILAGASSHILGSLACGLDAVEDVTSLIKKAIDPDASQALKEGGLIRAGFNERIDELRALSGQEKTWIAALEKKESERTGIPSLRVGFNEVFGYYIEVTHTHSNKVPPDYIRKQTLKNAERYVTPELKEHEKKILAAEEELKTLEYSTFLEIREAVASHTRRLQEAASGLATLDVLGSFAKSASEYAYTEPVVDDSLIIELRASRHPVLERTLTSEPFVPNDVYMDGDSSRMLVITGPNMAGKSTYIRQVALILIMAQMGSFVPAQKARIGIVDRLFTRIGASDELARGASTFMVEMNETANILNNATSRSLIILDEVGRGTSTFDGVSIAWAVSEYIEKHVRARTLFATHYHEMTQLAEVLEGVKNYNIAVKEWADEIIFLRKIVEGGTDKSYGIHVARLAGVPKEVIERAKVILADLEEEALHVTDRVREPSRPKSPRTKQLPLFRFEPHPVLEELKKLDPERMTPVEALQALAELRKKLQL